jgi:ABC-type sugar transport system ATPase subunit
VPHEGTLLELRTIGKRYGSVEALKGIDFQLNPNEIVAIVGDSGDIFVFGKRTEILDPMHARRLGIETVYQDLALVDTRDVVANLFLGRELTCGPFGLRLDKRRMASETKEILERLRIFLPPLYTPISALSGGQRQAVAVSRAAWGSRIVLMDEPTAALGVKEAGKVLDLIHRMKEVGTSVVVIAHNLDHVFSVADRVVVMRMGQVVGTRERADTGKEDIVALITGAA